MRSVWSGSLAFGLVNIPVRLNSAIRAKERVKFRLLHKTDLSPIRYERVCDREDEAVGGMRAPWAATAPSAKVAEESVARFCARAFDLPVTIARLNTVYGPDPRYMPSMNALAVARGDAVVTRGEPCPHSPIHIDDMVWQLEPLLEAAATPATVVNWCGDDTTTQREWSELAAEVAGTEAVVTVREVPGAQCQNVGDPTRRRSITGPCRSDFAGRILSAGNRRDLRPRSTRRARRCRT